MSVDEMDEMMPMAKQCRRYGSITLGRFPLLHHRSCILHQVSEGESLRSIAVKYEVNLSVLRAHNHLVNERDLWPKTIVRVPISSDSQEEGQEKETLDLLTTNCSPTTTASSTTATTSAVSTTSTASSFLHNFDLRMQHITSASQRTHARVQRNLQQLL